MTISVRGEPVANLGCVKVTRLASRRAAVVRTRTRVRESVLGLLRIRESGSTADFLPAADEKCQNVSRAPISIRRGAAADTG